MQVGHSGGDAHDRIEIRDNVLVGFPRFDDRQARPGLDGGRTRASIRLSGNVAWGLQGCPGDTTCSQDPRLTDMALATFDARPRKDSPLLARSIGIGCPAAGAAPRGPRPAGSALHGPAAAGEASP